MAMTDIARKLRRAMTPEERILWNALRRKHLGVKFRRQEPVGRYVLDFICFEHKLIVEADGSQHLNNPNDKIRDEFFTNQGFHVLRFWNSEIRNNLEGVLTKIQEAIADSNPPQH
jgi:very-short-patch-repair endonuclease